MTEGEEQVKGGDLGFEGSEFERKIGFRVEEADEAKEDSLNSVNLNTVEVLKPIEEYQMDIE
jgi:hypothetical protein